MTAAPRVILEDLAAPHQIVLRAITDPRAYYGGTVITVSCTCAPYTLKSQRGGRPAHEPIEARTLFPAAEAVAAWRAWHAEKGVAV